MLMDLLLLHGLMVMARASLDLERSLIADVECSHVCREFFMLWGLGSTHHGTMQHCLQKQLSYVTYMLPA